MLKTLAKLLTAGLIGVLSIPAGYVLLTPLGNRLDVDPARHSFAFMAVLFSPFAAGLFIAWGTYRILDRIWPYEP